MGRLESLQPYKPKTKRIAPIWRGVGCVLILIFTVGAYWLAGVLLNINKTTPFIPLQLGADLGFKVGPLDVPVGIGPAGSAAASGARVAVLGPVALTVGTVEFKISWMQVAATALVDIAVYGIMVIVYGLANPYKPGPLDAPPVRPKKGRQKSLNR